MTLQSLIRVSGKQLVPFFSRTLIVTKLRVILMFTFHSISVIVDILINVLNTINETIRKTQNFFILYKVLLKS